MKKLLTAVLALLLTLSLAACGLISPDEREVVTRHYDSEESTEQRRIYKVSNYDSLVSTLYNVLTERVETCVLRFFGYEGDEESDYNRATEEVLSSAIGKFAVYEMNGNIERIVTFYDASINITYKISSTKMSGMYHVAKRDDARTVAEKILRDGRDEALIFVEPQVTGLSKLESYFTEAYYKYPTISVYLPTITVSTAYDGSETEGRILSVLVGMPDTAEEREEKLAELQKRISDIVVNTSGHSTAERLYSALNRFGDKLTYVEQTRVGDRHTLDYTAYGAAINRRASSEGIALGFKALCDEMEIRCTVVAGRCSGTEHFWNIVAVGGEYYHVDAAYCNTRGVYDYFLKNDDDFKKEYSWDRDAYPICDGKPIKYMKTE